MKLVPYLAFNGNAEEAMSFYKELLNGEITYIMRYSDGPEEMLPDKSYKDKIMHASMIYNGDQLIYFSDMLGDKEIVPGNVNIHIDVESEEEVDKIFEYLSKEAMTIEMPLEVTFWNAKFGSLIDKYGIYWSINFDMKVKQEH
jgi:PhnB protein